MSRCLIHNFRNQVLTQSYHYTLCPCLAKFIDHLLAAMTTDAGFAREVMKFHEKRVDRIVNFLHEIRGLHRRCEMLDYADRDFALIQDREVFDTAPAQSAGLKVAGISPELSKGVESKELTAMKRVVCCGLAFASVLCLVVISEAQVKKGKTRVLQTKQLMGGLVRPNCAGIGEGLKTAPTDDKGWDELATKAALLNEASFVLMDDGRCPDGDWANAAKALREASAAVLAKIEAKDAAGAQAAFKGVTDSCGACHKAHKK